MNSIGPLSFSPHKCVVAFQGVRVTRVEPGFVGRQRWEFNAHERELYRDKARTAALKTLRREKKLGRAISDFMGVSKRRLEGHFDHLMADGEIHHVLPLSLGGNNKYYCLAVIDSASHTRIHRFLDGQTRNMRPGDSKMITLPIVMWGERIAPFWTIPENQQLEIRHQENPFASLQALVA